MLERKEKIKSESKIEIRVRGSYEKLMLLCRSRAGKDRGIAENKSG